MDAVIMNRGLSKWIGAIILLLTSMIFALNINAQQIWENDLLLKASFRSITNRAVAVDTMGNTHIVSTSDYIYYTCYDGENWMTETIDPHLQTLSTASIGIDPSGRVDRLGRWGSAIDAAPAASGTRPAEGRLGSQR